MYTYIMNRYNDDKGIYQLKFIIYTAREKYLTTASPQEMRRKYCMLYMYFFVW